MENEPSTLNITTKKDYESNVISIDDIYDREWVKSTFLLKSEEIDEALAEYKKWIKINRYFSSADIKITSTAPGMSIAVNPKPQFTRYADIRSPGLVKSRPEIVSIHTKSHPYGLGMGRYYSEAIDDNEQRIFLMFGVLKYKFLGFWLSEAFDIDRMVLQNRGIITSSIIQLVGMISKFYVIVSAPVLNIFSLAFNYFVSDARFCSVKETMFNYWATVDHVLNMMVARRTLLPTVLSQFVFKLDKYINAPQNVSKKFLSDFSESVNQLVPDIIDPETGRVNVFAIALRSAAAYNRVLYEQFEKSKTFDLSKDFTFYPVGNESHDGIYFSRETGKFFFISRLFYSLYGSLIDLDRAIDAAALKDKEKELSEKKKFIQSKFERARDMLQPGDAVNITDRIDTENPDKLIIEYDPLYVDQDGKPIDIPNSPDQVEQVLIENLYAKTSWWSRFTEYALAELHEGSLFAVFNVEHTGSVSESFSSSFRENPVQSFYNSLSYSARRIGEWVNSAAGDIPLVGDLAKLIGDTFAKVTSVATFGLVNPIIGLLYGVNLSLPKIWEGSSASLPRASYRIRLISPYGNPYSQIFNIYLPLAMLLTMSLPRSTGLSSYTSPFYLRLFDRGRVNIHIGMVENITITRGTSNLAFTRAGHPNAIDVDISIANLDEMVSVDIYSGNIIASAIKTITSPIMYDTPLETYINTITAVDVMHQIYPVSKIRLKAAERITKLKLLYNLDPAMFGMFTVSLPVASTIRDILGTNPRVVRQFVER